MVAHSCSLRSLFGLAMAFVMIGTRPAPARAQQPPQPPSREQQIKEFERQLEEMKKKLEELKGTATPAPAAQAAIELRLAPEWTRALRCARVRRRPCGSPGTWTIRTVYPRPT